VWSIAYQISDIIWTSVVDITNVTNVLFHVILFAMLSMIINAISTACTTYASKASKKEWDNYGPLITVLLKTWDVLLNISAVITATTSIQLARVLNQNAANPWDGLLYLIAAVILSMVMLVHKGVLKAEQPKSE